MARGHLDRQRSAREKLVNAARKWAELAGAAEHVGEFEVGTITNRRHIRQHVRIFVHVEELPREGVE